MKLFESIIPFNDSYRYDIIGFAYIYGTIGHHRTHLIPILRANISDRANKSELDTNRTELNHRLNTNGTVLHSP